MLIFYFFINGVIVSGQMTPSVSFHQKNQAKHIRQGVKSGRITPYEQQKLVLQQKLIHLQKTMIMADGII